MRSRAAAKSAESCFRFLFSELPDSCNCRRLAAGIEADAARLTKLLAADRQNALKHLPMNMARSKSLTELKWAGTISASANVTKDIVPANAPISDKPSDPVGVSKNIH